jgi:hypothetical protein
MILAQSKKICGVFIILITCLFNLKAQDSKADKKAAEAALITKIITEQNYTFTAQSVTPMGGRFRQLTTEYTVKVSKDTVISDLPYFGRAYSADIGSSEGGIRFTSTNFDYQVTERKKGGWDITIKPKDVPDAQQLSFSVFDSGSASLQVTSTNRQPISFNGYVAEKKNNKK